MITLNIISPELKNEIKLKNIYQILKKSFALISIFLIFYSVILISSRILLKEYSSEISQKNNTASKKTDDITKRVNEINKKINNVAIVQKDEINWLKLVALIAKNTSADVQYTRVSMSKNDGLSLSGQSKTREGLIKIKKFLDEADFLSDVDFPISNLLEKENINFNITAKIKNYDFK